jgi:polar amino acid transport system substrate-binding protein
VLHLAADFSAAPNQFIQNGQRRGLNPDLCGAIGKELGVKVVWTNLPFDGLIPGLLAKRFDALCTSVFITAAREQVMYMVPYVRWGDSLAIPSANPHHISCARNAFTACFNELSGLTIATTAGGAEEAQLKQVNTTLQNAGKSAIHILAFDTNTQAYQALLGGQADGVYVNDPQIHFFEKQHPGRFITAFAGFSPLQLSLTTRKDDLPLAKALQSALKHLKKTGSYQRILRKWGVLPASTFAINPPAQ